MKTIATTNDGNILVEMSQEEHRLLARLAGAADGELPTMTMARNYSLFCYDLADTFDNIRLWMEYRYQINYLKDIVRDLERAITRAND